MTWSPIPSTAQPRKSKPGPRLATVAGAKDLTEEKRGRGSVDLDLDLDLGLGSADVDGLNLDLDGEMLLAAAVMVVSFR